MEPTNRAAITYYRNFQKALEKIADIDPVAKSGAYKSQLSQLEINLKNVKKIEPSYDTTALDAELDKYKTTIVSQDKNKSLDKDLLALSKGFDYLDKILGETKLNFDNIDFQIESSVEAINRNIAIFKKNHPDYNTKELETKVADFQQKFRAKLQGAYSSQKDASQQKLDLEAAIYLPYLSWKDCENEDFIYGSHNPTGNPYLPDYIWSQDGINKLQSILDTYLSRADNYITKYGITPASNSSKSRGRVENSDGVSDYKSAAFSSLAVDFAKGKSVKEARTKLAEVKESANFKVEFYFTTMVDAYRVINASKIFNTSELQEIVKLNQEIIATMGTMEDYRTLILQNTLKNAKKVFMPKAKTENSEMEESAKIALTSRGWNEVVLKVNLLDVDWRLERNSDFIIGRVFSAAIATKKENGLCMLYNVTIRQEQLGDRFAQPVLYSYTSKYIAEENI